MHIKTIYIVLSAILLITSLEANTPTETAIFELEQVYHENWKRISREVNEKKGYAEFIPSWQSPNDWSERISIMFGESYLDYKSKDSMNELINNVRELSYRTFPNCEAYWNLLEQNENDFTYEWILLTPYKHHAPQHEVARIFLTEKYIHRVGIIRNKYEMSREEVNQWCGLFSYITFVLPYEEASKIEGFSLLP